MAPEDVAPYFRGHGVRAIRSGPDGLVLWVKHAKGETMTRHSLEEATNLHATLPEGALRAELDGALAACGQWIGQRRTTAPELPESG